LESRVGADVVGVDVFGVGEAEVVEDVEGLARAERRGEREEREASQRQACSNPEVSLS
jgi:hypothetical protein